MSSRKDLTGMMFGRLTAVSPTRTKSGRSAWECQCVCGNKTIVITSDLTHHRIVSCGCFNKEMVAKRNFKHGRNHHPLYDVWRSMKSRCYNPNDIGYHRYGERGIRICDEWLNSLDTFIQWCEENGYKKGLQIDRIDNDKGYYPDNCRFITVCENCKNKSNNYIIEYNGERKILKDWAEELGFSSYGLRQRIEKFGVEEAFSKPKRPLRRRFIECRGECKTITEWADEVGINPNTLHARLKIYPPEIAIFTPVGELSGKHKEVPHE